MFAPFASRLSLGCLALSLFSLTTDYVHADWRSAIGWAEFTSELGPDYPDGTGVLVAQGEADANGTNPGAACLPDNTNSLVTGKLILPKTPDASNSNHALNVARRFYGNTTSVAPGVTDIFAYEANDYLGALTSNSIPANRKVHCNAWVANFGTLGAFKLAEIDSRIQSNGYLLVAGLSNGSNTSVPQIFTSTYNALSVGRSNGNHSRNGTNVGRGNYLAGRIKPEVVIPETTTSWSTGAVSSIAAVLYQVAQEAHPQAYDHSEVIKAIIMAGATKQEFDGWDRTTTRPLDEVFGAGEAHILNSYLILSAGEQTPGTVAPTGWSFSDLAGSDGPDSFLERTYDFSVPEGSVAEDFSVILNWNYSGSGTPRDLKLELISLTAGNKLVDTSNSSIDNVEHIYRRHLPAGNYQLKVSRADESDDPISFALAWQSQFGDGPQTLMSKASNGNPKLTVTEVFKDQPYVIERSIGLGAWTPVHSFTPKTWGDYVWEDTDGHMPEVEVFYRCSWPSL